MGLNRPPHYCSLGALFSYFFTLNSVVSQNDFTPHHAIFPFTERTLGHFIPFKVSSLFENIFLHALSCPPGDPLKNSSARNWLHAVRWAVGWNVEHSAASTFAKHVARTVVTQHVTLGAILENNGNWRECRTPSGWQAACVDVKCFFSSKEKKRTS